MKKSVVVVVLALSLVALFAVTAAPASANLGRSPGYWANHLNAWWTHGVVIGGVSYTNAEACALMLHPAAGDKTYTMFNAVVTGTLNGSPGPTNDGSDWLHDYPLGTGVAGNSTAWQDSGEAICNALHATW